jgi:hypothetical protein
MRAQPTPQERPDPFHGLHMDFTKAVAIFIASELAPSMVHTLMLVSPDMQASLHAILVCINKCPWHDGVFDQGLDSLLLDIGQQIDHHLTTALSQPKDRWPLFLPCASATLSFEPASTSFALLGLHHLRLSFMAGNPRGFVALHFM